jgi:hypothetical protein
MVNKADVYEHCDWCGGVILFGNASVSLNLNVEQVDSSEEYPKGLVTVIQSEAILTLCANCGNNLDGDKLRDALTPAQFIEFEEH